MEFSRDELVWINNALAEVLDGPQAIADWEFHSRIGGNQAEVRALFHRLHEQVDALKRAHPEW